MALAPAVSGIADEYGDRLNVVWIPEASEQGRAAEALFDLHQRGVALLDRDHRLVWRATSATPHTLEARVRDALK
ncbi:MAG: hypothetical protein U0641_01400 [Anaerolineae bacterium]